MNEQIPTTVPLYYTAYDSETGVVRHVGKTEVGQRTSSGQPLMVQAEYEQELLDKSSNIDFTDWEPLPAEGEWVEQGSYSHGEDLLQCIQAHWRTHYEPSDTPALFRVARHDWDDWVQPLGAGYEYFVDSKVTHNGSQWVSDTPVNVYEPGVYGWVEQIEEPVIEAWVTWSGLNEDLYQIGDLVTYNGSTWVSTAANNHWTPGQYGWSVI